MNDADKYMYTCSWSVNTKLETSIELPVAGHFKLGDIKYQFPQQHSITIVTQTVVTLDLSKCEDIDQPTRQWRYYGGEGVGGRTPPPNRLGAGPCGHVLCGQLHTVRRLRTFFVSQDREKSTDSVQGATAQEPIDSVEGEESSFGQTTNNPLSPFVKWTFRFNSEWYFSQRSPPSPQPSTAVHAYATHKQVPKNGTSKFYHKTTLQFFFFNFFTK